MNSTLAVFIYTPRRTGTQNESDINPLLVEPFYDYNKPDTQYRGLGAPGGEIMNRRDIFRGASGGALAGLIERLPLRAAPSPGANIYERIGVQPVINCRGTFTIISGSQSLPEVKAAMEQASRHYVHLNELMDGVGKRLAE